MRKRAPWLAHIQNTHSPYHLPEIGKTLAYKAHRDGVAERFAEPSVHKSISVPAPRVGRSVTRTSKGPSRKLPGSCGNIIKTRRGGATGS
jgi:hypothetical protein